MSPAENGSKNANRPKHDKGSKRGFSLPPTTAKPPMPPVKQPKKQDK